MANWNSLFQEPTSLVLTSTRMEFKEHCSLAAFGILLMILTAGNCWTMMTGSEVSIPWISEEKLDDHVAGHFQCEERISVPHLWFSVVSCIFYQPSVDSNSPIALSFEEKTN